MRHPVFVASRVDLVVGVVEPGFLGKGARIHGDQLHAPFCKLTSVLGAIRIFNVDE
jgi:hypothetical protein